ncbi:CD209 antigen-like protein C [Podarcis muralis]
MVKPTPTKFSASRKRRAKANETGASAIRDLVTFFQSPTGERLVIFEIFILIAMTLLIYMLYKKEVEKRAEFQVAMNMIRTFVVGIDSNYMDKDDFQILAAAQNISEEMRYFANRNDQLQKEIDILIRNLDDGWIVYSRTFYFFSLELRSWMDSKKYCEQEGARLISVETKEEQFFINQQVKGRKMLFWIGLFKDKGGRWRWTPGMSPETTYWNYYEPNYEALHDCGGMTFDCYYEGCWMAFKCDQRIQYICKKVPDDAWL